MIHLADRCAHGLLRDRAGRADEDQPCAVCAALVDDVLCAVYIHTPNLLRHQRANGDHRRAVDDIGGRAFRDVCKERLKRGCIGHIAFHNIRAFRQVLCRLLAAQDKGANRLLLSDKLPHDGAAQIARCAGHNIKFVHIRIGIHDSFLRMTKTLFFVFPLGMVRLYRRNVSLLCVFCLRLVKTEKVFIRFAFYRGLI